ncbi:toll/interleukin-1 receptor domain-containing protein [Sciscionella sediminilitoris]|uniref:toll/interleukin-1 receptor domain-containing protein n=1 Tax=Sciscionella sediminilitoris TaxID=1445613 RepID=UPI00068D66A2|nr:toll/interleukin-1 receptor domain-containing protein [Sciscionella sp. SE31]
MSWSVFVNYRTGDEAGLAAMIERDLAGRFGRAEVFRASKSIEPGEDFPEGLVRGVRGARVLLAVIGARWFARGQDGRRLVDDPADWPRREIQEALGLGIAVVPVLVDNTPRLETAQLPGPLAGLARCQYVRVNHRTIDADLERLADAVRRFVPETAGQSGESEKQVRFGGIGHIAGNVGTIVFGSGAVINAAPCPERHARRDGLLGADGCP